MFIARRLNMDGRIAVEPVKSMIGGANIEMTIAVFTDVKYRMPVLVILEIAFDMVTVPTPKALVVGENPQITLAVLHQPVYGLSLA